MQISRSWVGRSWRQVKLNDDVTKNYDEGWSRQNKRRRRRRGSWILGRKEKRGRAFVERFTLGRLTNADLTTWRAAWRSSGGEGFCINVSRGHVTWSHALLRCDACKPEPFLVTSPSQLSHIFHDLLMHESIAFTTLMTGRLVGAHIAFVQSMYLLVTHNSSISTVSEPWFLEENKYWCCAQQTSYCFTLAAEWKG
jgi:hypothetical protein